MILLCLHMKKRFIGGLANVFMVPFGKAGKSFVRELAKLYQAYVNQFALHSIILMACSVIQPLLLQKPNKHSNAIRSLLHASVAD